MVPYFYTSMERPIVVGHRDQKITVVENSISKPRQKWIPGVSSADESKYADLPGHI